MFDYLFKSIPSIIFDPLAVMVLIWSVCAFFLCKKKNKFFFWTFCGIVFFMLVWRLTVHSLMASSRYASVLIYPAVIFSACLCLKSQAVFRWLFKLFHCEFKVRNQICKFLSAALFIGMFIACIGKSLHLDPFRYFIPQITEDYKKYSGGNGYVHIVRGEAERISWYIGKKLSEVDAFYVGKNEPVFPKVKRAFEMSKNIPGEHYFFFYLKKGETEPNADTMEFDKSCGTWEIVSRYYTARHKKKEFLLARYRPVCPNIEEWQGEIPASPKGNICEYGDFETPLSGDRVKTLEDYYKKHQLQRYADLSKRKLPHGWWFSIGRWNENNPPEFLLSDKVPLSGKFSLSVDSRHSQHHGVFNYRYFDVSCCYSMFVRGEGDKISTVRVEAVSRNTRMKKLKSTPIGNFEIHPGKVYRLHGDILCDKFEPEFRNFCLRMVVNGFVSIDQVSLVPLTNK